MMTEVIDARVQGQTTLFPLFPFFEEEHPALLDPSSYRPDVHSHMCVCDFSYNPPACL